MNKANLKSYAPKARLDFIKAVTERANILGITATGTAPAEVRGDVAIIDGIEWPAKVAAQREQLISRMQREGFAQTCEAVAYTWFNRFAALRYMELHDYLGHGHRALSSSTGNLPDILTHAADLVQSGANSGLSGLSAAKVLEMKLAGNRDGELYRMLLVAQCNALNATMPFLFERIDDDTELLLPDNLLRTDSVIAKLVQEIPEVDWAEVEIIGWLYQFYISEKKADVIGKVVKSEDIPAATQLFTPNWIVQYLVQNSVGRLWLMANPGSTLASQWPYYIQPAEQTPEVQAQLDALIQTRMDEDGGSLNPETITVLDPACGSGHILVVAYDVLKAIYLERGYQARAIPRLILEKNLYGLDIDDRAAQMAGFALLMKARADDRRLFNEPPKLNVLRLQESKGLDAAALAQAINAGGTERVETALLRWLIDTFEHAKTFGSLIKVGDQPTPNLRKLLFTVEQAAQTGDLYAQAGAQDVLPLVQQALVLGMQFDAVVANPPYMGGKGMNPTLKEYARATFPDSKSDLFAMFMERGFGWCKPSGFNSMVTMQSWMFLYSFQELRIKILQNHSLSSLVHLPYDGKSPTAMGINFGVSLEIFSPTKTHGLIGSFDCVRYFELTEEGRPIRFPSGNERNIKAIPDNFEEVPGAPVAYWVSERLRSVFSKRKLSFYAEPAGRCKTTNDDLYLRVAWEVDSDKVDDKWIYMYKGGTSTKHFGNRDYVINWSPAARVFYAKNGGLPNERHWGKEGITWTFATSSDSLAFRLKDKSSQYSTVSPTITFKNRRELIISLCLLNGVIADKLLKILNPTLGLNIGDVLNIPVCEVADEKMAQIEFNGEKLIETARANFNLFETSLEFSGLNFVFPFSQKNNLNSDWNGWSDLSKELICSVRKIEEENNRIFIEAFGLQEELSPEVPADQITLARADREKDCQRLISYAIGCMMGRYSLDEPGLIYAHAGNVGFDAGRYPSFPADADGIVPLTVERWFADDAAGRVREFLLVVWGADTLEDNMAWLADSLGTKPSETSEETIRRYLADKFFKDHLQTYKKRPIYWLFSSGKQGAFQALVYLHRYTEGTLARLRAEYVVPLITKVVSRLDMLAQDVVAASSAAARIKLQKQIEVLRKKQIELLAYDEKMRHYADMRITLDLDDGVKVNYGKFGDLLEGVKLVAGDAGDD